MKRNGYLMSKYLKFYMLASIFTMAISNLNMTVDSMLMGNILGPDALASINLVFPIQLALSCIYIILGCGCSLSVANSFGKRDYIQVKEIFSSAIWLGILCGILLLVFGLTCADKLVGLICKEEAIKPMVKEYTTVLISVSILQFEAIILLYSLEASGKPQLGTISICISVGFNIIFDVFFVYVLRKSIGYSALATGIGNAVSIISLIIFIWTKEKNLRLIFLPVKRLLLNFKTVITSGISFMFAQLTLTIMFSVFNYFIQKYSGADGLSVMGIGNNLINICMMIGSGIAASYSGVGGTLKGEGDILGMKFFWNTCLRWNLGLTFALCGLCAVFSGQIAVVFGADTQELVALARRSLPFVVFLVPAFSLGALLVYSHIVMNYSALCFYESFVPCVATPCCFIFVSKIFPADKIWLSFPLITIISWILYAAGAEIQRRKAAEKLYFLSLIPVIKEQPQILDISIPYKKEGLNEGLAEITEYCEGIADKNIASKVHICVEELLINIIEHAGRKENHFVDLKITALENKITATIRDDGRPFDPVHYNEQKDSYGLKILHGCCKEMDYRYAFGQNSVVMKWNIE